MVIFGGLLGIALLLLLYMLKEAFSNTVVEHRFLFANPKDVTKTRIFFISDIHRRNISDKIIAEVFEKVDIVIIGGDLVEGKVPLTRVRRNLEKLATLGPIYFVRGNNDYEVGIDLLEHLLMEYDVTILNNTSAIYQAEEAIINLIGIDDIADGNPDLEKAVSEAGKIGLRLLISHNPKIVDSICDHHGIQLILSGHTHGGQIRFFGLGLYENGGVKKVGNTLLLVSNGYGTTALPLRLGAKAQTHLITLYHS